MKFTEKLYYCLVLLGIFAFSSSATASLDPSLETYKYEIPVPKDLVVFTTGIDIDTKEPLLSEEEKASLEQGLKFPEVEAVEANKPSKPIAPAEEEKTKEHIPRPYSSLSRGRYAEESERKANYKLSQALEKAIKLQDLEEIKKLKARGAKWEQRCYEGRKKRTAFQLAAMYSSLEIVNFIKAQGVNLEADDSENKTALHLALIEVLSLANENETEKIALRIEVAKRLVGPTSTVLEMSDFHGDNPFHLLAKIADEDLLTYFLDLDFDTDVLGIENRSHKTPLDCVLDLDQRHQQRMVIAEKIFNCSGFSLRPNRDQETDLHYAARIGRTDVVRYLCERYGRDIILSYNEAGDNTLHIACKNNQLSVLQVLLTAMRDYDIREGIDQTNADGNTPLHLSVMGGNPEVGSKKKYLAIVQILIAHRANTICKNNNDQTPWNFLKEVRGKNNLTEDEDAIRELIKNQPRNPFQKWGRSFAKHMKDLNTP